MSRYWFDEACTNDLLRLEGPLGTFSYRENDVASIVFLATGTGIAPIKAILEELALNAAAICGKKIYVYWGARRESDFYHELTFPNLRLDFIPVLSRASIDWSGRTGYIQECVVEDGVDLTSAVVYACGSEGMIRSAKELLVSAGLQARSFYSDAFVSSK